MKLKRDEFAHARAMAEGERGWLGFLFGGPNNAPTYIAFFAMMCGILIGVWALYKIPAFDPNAANAKEFAEFWSKHAERSFAFAAAALSFIFGRTSK